MVGPSTAAGLDALKLAADAIRSKSPQHPITVPERLGHFARAGRLCAVTVRRWPIARSHWQWPFSGELISARLMLGANKGR